MIKSLQRVIAMAVLACGLAAQAAPAPGTTTKYKINLPPSAELAYSIKAKQKGFPVEGDAVMRWEAGSGRFVATNEARAMLVGKILDARSEGRIDAFGLAPETFIEKRFRKEQTTTTFDRESGTIRFTASEHTYPITGGEQDRNSVIWQLVAVARGAPGKVKPGASWNFFVASLRKAEPWTFRTVRQEKIRTPLGDLNTLHISRMPQADSKEQQVDIWLAPSLEWYPVRVRFSDDNGDYVEQSLQSVSKIVR
ncbi:DUF3108 domain-containing protein [Herbaspirillum sp. HC18]|nr:DUF3108 domain-containing protein [Herbaspirillum sp. HC18]